MSDRGIVGRRGRVFMDWNFGNYKVEWKVRLGTAEGGQSIERFRVSLWRWCQLAEAKEQNSEKKSNTSHGNGKPGKRKKVKDGTNTGVIKTGIIEWNNKNLKVEGEKQAGWKLEIW